MWHPVRSVVSTFLLDRTVSSQKTVIRNTITKIMFVLNTEVGSVLDCVWNVMAHAQKPDFVFRRNGRVHLNRRGRQFSRLLAAEVCASAVVMPDTRRSEVVWRVLATHSIRQFPFTSPSVRHRVPSGFKLSLRQEVHWHLSIMVASCKVWMITADWTLGRVFGSRSCMFVFVPFMPVQVVALPRAICQLQGAYSTSVNKIQEERRRELFFSGLLRSE